jgi:hypothetical protein
MQIKITMFVAVLVLLISAGYVLGRMHQIELTKEGMKLIPDINQCFP